MARLWTLLICLALGCDSSVTQTIVVFSGDASARSADRLRIAFSGDSTMNRCAEGEVCNLDIDLSDHPLPIRMPLVPRDGDANRRFSIVGELLDSEGKVINSVRASSGYIDGEKTEIELRFTTACQSVECGSEETCLRGSCVDACLTPEGRPCDEADAGVDADLMDADASAMDADAEDADTMVVDGDATVPDADANAPDADATVPDADATVPDADATVPDADANVPDADANVPDAMDPRVENGLVLLYTFEEGSGNTVMDRAPAAGRSNLTIENPGNVSWQPGFLRINSATRLNAAGPGPVKAACETTSEITIEAWFRSSQPSYSGPVRFISFSQDAATRNFMFGLGSSVVDPANQDLHFRLRTNLTDTTANGFPILLSPNAPITSLSHVVATHQGGTTRLYLNGTEVVSGARNGNFTDWGDFSICVANECGGDRPYLGELHLIALYCEGFSAQDVMRNFVAGANPEL